MKSLDKGRYSGFQMSIHNSKLHTKSLKLLFPTQPTLIYKEKKKKVKKETGKSIDIDKSGKPGKPMEHLVSARPWRNHTFPGVYWLGSQTQACRRYAVQARRRLELLRPDRQEPLARG